MDDDLMRVWEATQESRMCTCNVCRNLGIQELVHDYDWRYAEWSLTRDEWMPDPDGLAPIYMERQQALREREEAEIRAKLWLTRKGLLRRLWNWVRTRPPGWPWTG